MLTTLSLNELYILRGIMDDWIYQYKQQDHNPDDLRDARNIRNKVSNLIEEEENK